MNWLKPIAFVLAAGSLASARPMNSGDDSRAPGDTTHSADALITIDDACASESDQKRPRCTEHLVASLIKGASISFKKGDYLSALGQLGEAKQYDPANPLFYYDEALILNKMGERQKAIYQLDLCILFAHDGRKKEDAELFRAGLVTQEPLSWTKDRHELKRMKAVNQNLVDLRSRPRWDTRVNVSEQLPCETELENTSPVVFNRGFCAEIRGDMTTAADRFRQYVGLAPKAQDAEQVKEHIRLLSQLSDLQGVAGEDVRKLYGEITLYSSLNRFDIVRERLKNAERVLPDFVETKREIAKLAIRCADFAEARQYYELIRLNPRYANEAQERIDWINWNEQDYKDAVQAAAATLAVLVQSRLDNHEPESAGFHLRLEQVVQYLISAIAISDLGTEAHALLATVSLLTGNYILATNSADIVSIHDAPVVFFDRDGRRIEIWHDRIAVKDVSTLLPADRLRPSLSQDETAPQNFFISSISKITVQESAIRLSLPGEDFTLIPAFEGPIPQTGPLARKYANDYVRLITRYLPVSHVKYATERLSKKEMGELGLELFATAAELILMAQGRISNQPVTKGQRISDLSNAVKYFMAAKQSARVIVYFIEVLKERQRVTELPTLKVLPSREPLLQFRTVW